ncbi:MAG: IS1634 family transposase [Planctomycetes bacterium]|nr:IS1634 family transposase [Planctomycetota bacterium]
MSITHKRTLKRLQVGGLPLIHAIAERMSLKAILSDYITPHGNELIPSVDSLILLIYNLTLGKYPLYELTQWVDSHDWRCIGCESIKSGHFNDDRFGRALDKLYLADRASLMTTLVVTMSHAFELDLSRLHNDSTSVKAFGKIPGKTRTQLELKKGHSKDHRPDLKQLVFSLSISADGGVPIHHKAYAGNRTDDTTHIETWNSLRALQATPHFLYVGDAKLCTDEQLSYLVTQGGRAITMIPETWGEVKAFKTALRRVKPPKRVIWRRRKPGGSKGAEEYFSTFQGSYTTTQRGYRIHWIYSSEKRQRDRLHREQRLSKAEQELLRLTARINRRALKTKEAIEAAAQSILATNNVAAFFYLEVGRLEERHQVQVGRGRPGKETKYQTRIDVLSTLSWTRKVSAIKDESNTDGIFPLLSTDERLSSKEVLQAYKYQPTLEKRFTQFKSIHNAAPLLFKKIERIEGNMFAFFIALMIQALLEREVRQKMKEQRIKALKVYPEEREARCPTTSRVLNIFDSISTYQITENSRVVEEYKDDLNDTQKLILEFLNITQNRYWLCDAAKN